MDDFKLIIFTFPESIPNEIEIITLLFENGLNILHLRKPHDSLNSIANFIEKIPIQFHSKIVIHSHFSLLETFELKGIHLNNSNKKFYSELEQHNRQIISTSCHSINELNELKNGRNKYKYVFLSPIFDSISKNSYCANFTQTELIDAKSQEIISRKIVALGGIEANKIEQIKAFGFGGIGILGAIWRENNFRKKNEKILQKFIEIRNKCHTVN